MLYQLEWDDTYITLIQQLQLEKDHVQQEKDRMQQERDHFKKEKDQIKVEKEQEIEQIQQEKDTLQHQRDSVLRENGRLQQEKNHLQHEKNCLQQEKNHLQHEKNCLQQEKNRITQHNEQLQREKEQIQQERDQLQRDREQLHWVVTREEIRLTPVVLGAGAYGEVKIAEFRGIKVAAKCLHNIILSPYILGLFSREMEIASRLRHPNLVQFVGATREGAPIIISELMSTSLHKELQQSGSAHGLDRPTVVNISRDVACALNYLHLWRPHPILHRDISSPNVLLEDVVGRGWKAKLSDFGSANIQFQTSTKMPGNPCYAPPEADQPHKHSPAMDVYSYGVLVMEMCVHQPPGLTVPDKQRQIDSISWSTMKDLVVRCVNEDCHQRPSISQVLAQLANIK